MTSERESRYNVPFGYLAVLLSFLSVDRHVKRRVASQLPGKTIKPLLDAVGEFLHYHRKVAEEIHQTGGETDIKAIFISRLEAVVNSLSKMDFA